MEWQPIESAPLDGRDVLIFDQDMVTGGYFDDGLDSDGEPYEEAQWIWFTSTDTGPAEPTHWMPFPETPRSA